MTTSYGISIPTRGRREKLYETIKALAEQTHPPSRILIIDNNDEPDFLMLSPIYSIGSTRVEVVKNSFDVPGIIQGDQTGLFKFAQLDYEIAGRWDDDLVPLPDCMERLVHLVASGQCPAAGGMYPQPDTFAKGLRSGIQLNGEPWGGDGNPRHFQFFAWDNDFAKPWLIRRHFLYSSFIYHVRTAFQVGGFCTQYSQHSYRADTDFTLRLNKLACWNPKNLIVDPEAVAMHKVAAGGTRSIVGEEKARMMREDLALFERRMEEHDIDPNY